MKKAGPFKYRRVAMLPSDTGIANTRYYLMTDKGNFWAPPFVSEWLTFETDIDTDLTILNAFAIRLDLEEATKVFIGTDTQLKEGETIAFGFRISCILRRFDKFTERPKSNDEFRGPTGQHQSGIRLIYGPTGKVVISGMARVSGSSDDTKQRHSLAQHKCNSRPSGKTLPVRSTENKDADPRN